MLNLRNKKECSIRENKPKLNFNAKNEDFFSLCESNIKIRRKKLEREKKVIRFDVIKKGCTNMGLNEGVKISSRKTLSLKYQTDSSLIERLFELKKGLNVLA